MLKTRKFILSILEALTLFCVAIAGLLQIHAKPSVVSAASPTVVCQGIANDVNNNILETTSPAKYRTLLAYDITLGTEANTKNVVSTTGEGILLNGVKLSEISGVSIDYAHGKRYIQIRIPQSYQDALTGDIVLEVVAGTTFENQVLDSAKFALKGDKWAKVSAVSFTGIQWNNIGYGIFEGKPGVLLNYSAYLSTVFDEINGGIQSANFASTVGENIYLGGVKLSTLPGALVAYHSQNKLFIYANNMATYRTLTIKAGTLALDSVLPETNLYFNTASNQWGTTSQTNYTPVSFTTIQWNNIGYGLWEGKKGVLLTYSANLSKIANEINAGIQTINFAQGAIGEKITLGGVKLKDIAGAEICYHSQGHLWIYAPNMTELGMIVMEETNFLDVTLPSLWLTFNGAAWEIAEAPAEPTVVCQGIANVENNNILETTAMGNPVPVYRTLLKYDITLGNSANTNNVVSTTGQGILLNGVKLSDIPNAYIDYAHGSKYIQIKIPQSYQDALKGEIILEVVKGTEFENQVLDAAKFRLRNGAWVTYVEPKAVEFKQIQWNETDYDFYGGRKGVLLAFSENLSSVASEINGGMQSVNLAASLGEYIYVGGKKLSTLPGAYVIYHAQNFLFIYADNMSLSRTITIEEGTVALDSRLPEVNLYYGANKWSTTPTNVTPVTLDSIRWNNIGYGIFEGKGGVLLKFSANLSTLASEWNGGAQAINLAKTGIGDKIKLGGTPLSEIDGAEIHYHSQENLWIYAPNMTTLGNLTIETTDFLDVTLPNVALTFNGSAWAIDGGSEEPDTPDEPETPANPTVVCQGIANDVNNNILETVAQGNPVPRYRTLLKYDIALGVAANSKNVVSTTGAGILLNGVRLCDIPNTSIDYGHGSKYIQIKIPQEYQDGLEGDIVLEVLAGTPFESQILDASKFVLRNGQWAP